MNILLISEQIVGDRNFIEKLKTAHKVDVVAYVSTALYRLRVIGYDLVIIEIGMPSANSESLSDSKAGVQFHEDHLKELGVPTILWLWNADVQEETPDINFVLREHNDNHLLNAVNSIFGQ